MANVKYVKEPTGFFKNVLGTGAMTSTGIKVGVATLVNELYAGKAKNTITNIKEVTMEVLEADSAYVEVLEENDKILATENLSPRRRKAAERKEAFLEAAQETTLQVQLSVM